ncbi:MAG: deoxyribodipyrimidine photo-lyase [Spirochaetia bacterium]
MHSFDDTRVIREFPGSSGTGPSVYWMSRDQRIEDNWALVHAQNKAFEKRRALCIVFCFSPSFLEAGKRQYDFMLQGLKETAQQAQERNIGFNILIGVSADEVPRFLKEVDAAWCTADFSPLRISGKWQKAVGENASCPLTIVDAHNIVPCSVASNKQEYAAYTFRPKIHKKLDEYLTGFPEIKKHPYTANQQYSMDFDVLQKMVSEMPGPDPVRGFHSGTTAAFQRLEAFLEEGYRDYSEKSNDPVNGAQSRLSPYLHFGQIAAQRIAIAVLSVREHFQSQEDFLEQLIVRKELSDNYCYYNPQYDSLENIPDWAKKTLSVHWKDEREYVYTKQELENGRTHDDIWNAAQIEMAKIGYMQGYIRMYWAKKILEWTHNPEEAFSLALELNNKYELDGRDPNGYVGVAWSIGGVHDRAWKERPIFGKIRYMSAKGCRRKFDMVEYTARFLNNE